MLSWMRWLTGWFWNIVNADGISGGFLNWFSDNWLGLAVFLIIVGVVVDWLIWMIRWRPYWLWLRKRQIIYEEVPVRSRKRRPEKAPVKEEAPPADEFEDPFAAASADPYAAASADADNDLAEWDSADDPYARQDRHTDYDPAHAKPVLGGAKREGGVRPKPVFGERMKHL